MSDDGDQEKLVSSSTSASPPEKRQSSSAQDNGDHEESTLLAKSNLQDAKDIQEEELDSNGVKEHVIDSSSKKTEKGISKTDNGSENGDFSNIHPNADNGGLDSMHNMEPPLQSQQSQQSNTSSYEENMGIATGDVIITQPTGMSLLCPPQLESLLDCMQVVIHKDNLRHNIDISESAIAKYEVINETRRVMFYVEKEPAPMTDQSFHYRIYDKNKLPAIEVLNPQSSTCFMCHSSLHCFQKLKFQAVIMAPPGIVAGFVRRSHTCLLQEFEILSPQEDVLLLMRGGPYDLELYSTDLDTGLGRMAVHGWHGIMHEVKRSGGDIGLTFPFDLDVRVKAILLGAVFAIDWLYSTRNGTRS